MNATQILKYLEEEYQIEQVDRRSVYRDIKMLQFCGYEIYQCADKRWAGIWKNIYFRTGKLKLCWMQYSRQDAFLQRKQRNWKNDYWILQVREVEADFVIWWHPRQETWILIGKQDTTLKQCWKLCISIKNWISIYRSKWEVAKGAWREGKIFA